MAWITRHALIAAACVAFLAVFSMKFYMDNSNDSETDAYVSRLLSAVHRGALGSDATGHYTGVVGYLLWPLAIVLQPMSGIFQIRAFVFVYVGLAALLYGLAWLWYRELGLRFLSTLVGLLLLSVCLSFALLSRGWELDKMLEPALFLGAALATWRRHFGVLLGITALAVANRETGALLPLVALAAPSLSSRGVLAAARSWPVWGSALICLVGVVLLRLLGPPADASIGELLSANSNVGRMVYVLGGLCFLPLLALAWVRSAPEALQLLFWLLTPLFVVLALATDHLEQGALLLTPVAVVCVPIALLGVERALGQRLQPSTDRR